MGGFEFFEPFNEDEFPFFAFLNLVFAVIYVKFEFFDLVVEDSVLAFVLSLDFKNMALESLEFESEGVVVSEDLFELGFRMGVQLRRVRWIRLQGH